MMVRPFNNSYSTAGASAQSFVMNGKRLVALGTLVGAGVFLGFGPKMVADEALQVPNYPFEHKKMLKALDHRAIRRGYQVYKEVCASCHSLDLIAWRNYVGVIGTEEEVKGWAEGNEYPSDPDSQGEIGTRKGKLTDHMPRPYPNEQAARAGNNGALPPDLSLIKKARVGGEDYLFALLTGYRDPPAGMTMREGMHYNPYFPGSAIGMAQALQDEMLEYEDGTPASVSQMAKDVSTFLTWTAEPEHDDRKRMGFKALFLLGLMILPTLYMKRLKWSVVKTRKIRFEKL